MWIGYHGTSDDDAARVWHAAAWYGEPIGRGNAADLARHAAVAFLCQVLQEPWNFRSRQGRHPHNFQSDTDRVVFGMAADCFRISNFTLWLHGVYVAGPGGN